MSPRQQVVQCFHEAFDILARNVLLLPLAYFHQECKHVFHTLPANLAGQSLDL